MFYLIYYFHSPDVRFSDQVKVLVAELKSQCDKLVIIHLSILICYVKYNTFIYICRVILSLNLKLDEEM